MSELLRETINAAERVIAGVDSRVGDYLGRLLSSPGELRSGEDFERVYLAALLDFIGLHDEAVDVLRDAPDAMSRNMEGMLAAAHGQHEQARNILVEALDASTDSPLVRKQMLVNLAAVSLRAGSVGEAEAWIGAAAAIEQAENPAVDVLIATVRASIASRRGDLQALRSAAASLEEASKSRLAELGTEHPQALAIVANMASAEIMLARADNSAVRLERAIDVLEVAAFRLAAEFGVDHPQAKAAMASLAAARAEPASVDAAVLLTEQVTAEERTPSAPDEQRLAGPLGVRIVLTGPPGAGKGTQAHFIASHLAIPRISIGDIFRYNVTHNTGLGTKAKEHMDRGDLVPHAVTVAMVRDRLAEDDAQAGFLLDGFPRNVPQAETLKKMLAEFETRLTVVLELVVDEDEVVRRLSDRRTCRRCERVWHMLYDPPARPGICDDCGGELFQRDDDKEDVIRHRLEVYNSQTAPLIAFYADEGILVGIDATGSVEEVTSRALSALAPYVR
jgi:adenylate kinase